MKKMLKNLIAVLPIIVILVLFSCQDTNVNTPQTKSLNGVVSDPQDVPVPLAQLKAVDSKSNNVIATTSSDEDGNFTFSNLPQDNKEIGLSVEHSDFKAFDAPLSNVMSLSVDGKKTPIRLQNSDSCWGTVIISLTQNSTNLALGNAEVRMNRGTKLIRKSFTNTDGRLVFERVCPGSYWVRIAKAGFKVLEREFVLAGTDTTFINYSAISNGPQDDSCCNGVVEFTIRDSTNNDLLPGVNVDLWQGDTRLNSYQTNGDGKIIFRGLCPGQYKISFNKDRYRAQEFFFNIECNDTLRITKRMLYEGTSSDSCCDGSLTIIPRNRNQEVLNGATVRIWKDGQLFRTVTVTNGVAFISGLCQGVYGVDITKEGYRGVEFQVEIGCNENKEVTKLLDNSNPQDTCCKGIIHVIPKNANGEVLNGATVKLWKNGTLIRTTTVTNGKAGFDGLCEGSYSISISKEGYKGIEFSVSMECNQRLEFVKKLEGNSTKDTCCKGVITIIPKNMENTLYLNGAVVKIYKNGAVFRTGTVANNKVVFDGLCEGTYNFVIMKEGYKSIEFSITMECNQKLEVVKKLEGNNTSDSCCKGIIHVITKNKANNEIINGATVKLWKGDKLIGTSTVTNGKAGFDGLCKGLYVIEIITDRYKRIEFKVEVGCNQKQEIVKYLELLETKDTCCKGVIFVIPKNKENTVYLNGATVKLWKDGKLIGTATVTNNKAGFDGLCAGKYSISITKEGYKGIEFYHVVVCNQRYEIVKNLESTTCCTAALKLYIRNRGDEEIVTGANIVIKHNGTVIAEGRSNEEGKFSKSGLCAPATYNIRVVKDGFTVFEGTIQFTECNTKIETIWLLRE
ncbi:MAG: hypothetical protein HW421_1309 [Ignavibacteria bacterium]|nr:hypothetical protein [Ignavibacteria bacterium]